MSKVKITSPEFMAQDQIRDDVAMTPSERLERAFEISDFALEIQQSQENANEEQSSIQWIELDTGRRDDREEDNRKIKPILYHDIREKNIIEAELPAKISQDGRSATSDALMEVLRIVETTTLI